MTVHSVQNCICVHFHYSTQKAADPNLYDNNEKEENSGVEHAKETS